MCQCSSCSFTDSFKEKGFAAWPRGNPAGRKSAADYSAHMAFAQKVYREKRQGSNVWETVEYMPDKYRTIPREPVYSTHGTPGCGPVTPAPKWLLDWINRKAPDVAETTPASPAQACKPEQHFPTQDRPRETAVIYAMPKSKPKEKRARGRPPIDGRRVVIKLEDRHIKRAEELGAGNVAAGIRKALISRSSGRTSS